MINPWKVHRARAVVTHIETGTAYPKFTVKLEKNGRELTSWAHWRGVDLLKGIKVGDVVNIQSSFSITADQYLIESVNKPRKRKAA